MPVGEIIKDPITGIEYAIVKSYSGKDLKLVGGDQRTRSGSSMERCVDLGDRPRRKDSHERK